MAEINVIFYISFSHKPFEAPSYRTVTTEVWGSPSERQKPWVAGQFVLFPGECGHPFNIQLKRSKQPGLGVVRKLILIKHLLKNKMFSLWALANKRGHPEFFWTPTLRRRQLSLGHKTRGFPQGARRTFSGSSLCRRHLTRLPVLRNCPDMLVSLNQRPWA